MKLRRLSFLAPLFLSPAIAGAATILSYVSGVAPTAGTTGAADPTSQGWSANAGAGTTAFSYGADSTIGGWRITDGTSTAPFFYEQAISASGVTDMTTNGWVASFTVATNEDAVRNDGVPNGAANYYNAPNQSRQINNAFWIELKGGFRYILSFRSDASNNLVINDGTSNYKITTANNQLSSELGTTVANYVTYTLSYDVNTSQATLTDSLSGNHGVMNPSGAGTANRVVWGATSSSTQGSTTWNNLLLNTIPEPSSAALFALGSLTLLRRRKRH